MRWKILGAHRARDTGGPRSASAAARSLKNAKRKRGSEQPQEREAQARQRAASRTRSASAAASSLKNAKRKRGSEQPQENDRQGFLTCRIVSAHRAPLQLSLLWLYPLIRYTHICSIR